MGNYQRTDILKGFKRGTEDSLRLRSVLQGFNDKAFTEYEAIIDLLEERKGAWEFQEGELVFFDDNDAKRFNEHMIAIQDLTDREEELVRWTNEKEKQKLHDLSAKGLFD